MAYVVSVKTVRSQPIAAARARMAARDIPTHFRQSLDKVWTFLGHYPHLKASGHNLFLYHHDMDANGAMTVDFGVQVAQRFAAAGEVFCAMTPAGEIATTTHRGPYAGLRAGHEAIRAWIVENEREDGGYSWEIYGDWNDDPKKLETQIVYLLR